MTVRVRVPASTTNLGPGFDALGMALRLHNMLEAEEASDPRVEIEGEGAERLPRDPSNLVYRTMAAVYREAGREAAFHLRLRNEIPVGRGLGSSAAAIVGGLVAANLLLGAPLSGRELLRRAVELEGHPDNVTPALLGGFHVALTGEDGEVVHLQLPNPTGLRAVLAVPEVEIATADARAALPESVSRADAVFNVGRVALLIAALAQGRSDLLAEAMQDRLHQPYRARLLPGFPAALEAAVAAGAAGACLSGSGSTLLALTRGEPKPVADAMCAALAEAGVASRWLALEPDEDGAVIERAAPSGDSG